MTKPYFLLKQIVSVHIAQYKQYPSNKGVGADSCANTNSVTFAKKTKEDRNFYNQ
jgi:hypothetical protein